MDGLIAHHHVHYRILGSRDSADRMARRLDGIVREQVVKALAEALDQAFENDPTVYILRRVDSSLLLNMAAGANDAQLARRWGERLAGTVVRTIAANSDDGTSLVRFADQADYVAHFVIDLLQDRAWQRWFYRPFVSLRAQSRAETLEAVLFDNRDHLPAILAYLHQSRALEKLLATLEPVMVGRLWSQGLGGKLGATPEMIQPLFLQVWQLAERLGLWRSLQPDSASLFPRYLAGQPAYVDWRDRSALTGAILDIWRFLLGYMQPPEERQDFQPRLDRILVDFDWLDTARLRAGILETITPNSQTIRPLFGQVIGLITQLGLWAKSRPDEEALLSAYLDSGSFLIDLWRRGESAGIGLDIARFLLKRGYLERSGQIEGPAFRAMLERALAAGAFAGGPERPDLPLKPAGSRLTPRQETLLEALMRLLREGQVSLEGRPGQIASNALRWYGALVAQAPQWAGDSLATTMIRELVAAWELLGQSRAPAEALRALRQGQLEAALGTLPEAQRGSATPAFNRLISLGEPALRLVALLSKVSWPPERAGKTTVARPDKVLDDNSKWPTPFAAGSPEIETPNAGIFLLLRAVLDARLPWLVREVGYPPQDDPGWLSALLLALGLRWGGEGAMVEGQLDPGLGPFVGLDRPPAWEKLYQLWAETTAADHRRFQTALLHVLTSHRLVRGHVLHLYTLAPEILIGGDGGQGLWPFGQVVESDDQKVKTLVDWVSIWTDITGQRPIIVGADEALLKALPAHVEARAITSTDEGIELAATDELSWTFLSGQKALPAALTALSEGQLGLPEVDLTIALTAIALLRIWARWLRQFSSSSTPYLLENFIRRPGSVFMDDKKIRVEMSNRPLDIILDMAGYLAPLEQVTWLDKRQVEFQLRDKL